MKKLMFATALVASAAAFADPTALNAISFEGYSENDTFTNGTPEKDEVGQDKSGNPFFYFDGEGDGSSVKLFATGDAGAVTAPKRPFYFQGVSPAANYLELSTEGGTLWRSINPISVTQGETTTYGLGPAQDIANDGTYLDTLVQFTPTEDGGAPELDAADKLAIWLNVDGNGVTNLMVKAGSYDDEGARAEDGASYVLTGKTVVDKVWYRLTVKAVDNILPDNEYYKVPGFQVFIDGVEMSATTAPLSAVWLASLQEGEVLSAAQVTELSSGKYLPSRLAGENSVTSTLQGVGFKGSGALDDIVWTEENPFQAPAGIDFSLTWPSGLTAVSYTIGNGSAESLTGETSPFAVPGLEGGETVYFLVQNADGVQKTLSATAADGEGIDATSTTFTWADYLGAAVDGAYEIDNLAELKLFQKGVANTNELTTANTTFKLTADIALDAAWPGIGLQNGKDVYSTQQFDDEAFLGTFDGQNHTISGFQMVGGGLDYCGFFNSTYGATIQNLKIAYAGGLFAADTAAEPASNESGATFVGVAKNSTLRNLTTVAGTVSCYKGFGGIVGYLTSGTLVDSCTNNVNMTSLKPNKCGGIAMITQGGSAVTVRDCQNNGTIAGSNETGSLIGFIGLDTFIENCESTVAYKLFHHNSGVAGIQGITAVASVDSYTGAATTNVNFATVDNGVATFVADDALAAGNIYKVMHTATATYEFTAAGSISFDTNLIQAVTFAITAAQGLDAPTEATANGVVTFTVAAAGGDDYVVEIAGSDVVITPQPEDFDAIAPYLPAGVTTNDVAAVNALLATEIGSTGIPAWQAAFLGLPPTEAGLAAFKIDSITIGADGKVTVTLPAGVDPKAGRGVTITLKLMKADTPNAAPADWTQAATAVAPDFEFSAVTPDAGDTKKFYKVVVDFAATPQN